MSTILSPTAIAHVAERHVREAGTMTELDLVSWLRGLQLEPWRLDLGLRVAFDRGRLVRVIRDGAAVLESVTT